MNASVPPRSPSGRKRVVLLGATGSIGENTLRVIAAHPDRLELVGIAARASRTRLAEIVAQFPTVRHVGLFEPTAHASARASGVFPANVQLHAGLEGLVTRVGDDVGPGGTTPAAAGAHRLVLGDGTLLDECVEVATDGRRRQLEVPAELGSGDRALGRDHVQDSGPGARLERGAMVSMVTLPRVVRRTVTDKHHTIVT